MPLPRAPLPPRGSASSRPWLRSRSATAPRCGRSRCRLLSTSKGSTEFREGHDNVMALLLFDRLLMEVLFERLPAGVVLVLKRGRVHGELCWTTDETSLEHEGQCARELHRFEFGVRSALEGLCIGAMA